MSFSFDATQPAGQRIRNLVILDADGAVADVVVENGTVQGDENRPIRMVTLSFLAGGGDGYPFASLASDRIDLADQPIPTGGVNVATFANSGTEQDALAEYLAATYPINSGSAFAIAEVQPALDLRIQNLQFRQDTVLQSTCLCRCLISSLAGLEPMCWRGLRVPMRLSIRISTKRAIRLITLTRRMIFFASRLPGFRV
uniref:Uncharacterized protein n=1 Tax=Desertifilum tharense IPPAS B-1220 TaxID=1781255 RepID=A0ACD5GPI4_9CYAN